MNIPEYRFPRLIKEALATGRLTAKEIAEHVKIHHSTVSDWVRVKAFPRENKIKSLASLFDISPEELSYDILSAKRQKQLIYKQIAKCIFYAGKSGGDRCLHIERIKREISVLEGKHNGHAIRGNIEYCPYYRPETGVNDCKHVKRLTARVRRLKRAQTQEEKV